jgi:hypothetical protein
VLLIDARACIGVDGWVLNIHFWWTFPKVGMTPLV